MDAVLARDEAQAVSSFLKRQREVLLQQADSRIPRDVEDMGARHRGTLRATGDSKADNRAKDRTNSRHPWEALASNLALAFSLAIAREAL